jgi:UDP-glucose 4-epimerase
VLVSSAAVYGDNPIVPKTEEMLPEPRSPYAVTKLDGEYYFELYRREYGLGATSLRFFNVFGPRQNPRSRCAAAAAIFIQQAIDGGQPRDFIYVKDIVSALRHVVRNGIVDTLVYTQIVI